MTGRIQNEVSLVTGAASGIGKAVAMLFAEQGATVIVADLDEKKGQSVVEQIKDKGGKADFFKLNVASESEWRDCMTFIKKNYKKLNSTVNNAGFATEANVEATTLEEWKKIEAVNLEGLFLATKYQIALMKENDPVGGSIVQMCSSSAIVGIPELAAYAATKGAVQAFTRAVAVDCAQKSYHIRVNNLCPGYIQTPLVDQLCETDPTAYEELVSRHPEGRLGTPEEVAYAALYLASPESKFTTGSSLVVDGGYTIR